MISVKENTTLVGISELRTRQKEILTQMKRTTLILEKRNKPIAVLLPLERYEALERAMEWLEDQALGYSAHQREKRTPKARYIPLSEAEKRVGLR